MTAVQWNNAIPCQALVGSFQSRPVQSYDELTTDDGASIRSAKPSRHFRQVSFKVLMTPAQYALLETFFTDTCRGGALPFYMKHPMTGIVKKWQWASESPQASDEQGIKLAVDFEVKQISR